MTRSLAGLLLACALPAAAAGASRRSPQEIVRSMELLCAEQKRLVPVDAAVLDSKLRAHGEELRALGLAAVPLLAWHVRAKERPLKARVYSAAVLGMIREPEAFPALKAALEDDSEDPGLRSACLQSIGSLGLEPGVLRPLLEKAVGPPFPDSVVRESLSQLAWLGSGDLRLLEKAARRHGPSPRGLEQGAAAHAVAAIGRSASSGADAALFRLLSYFKRSSPLRGKVVSALSQRHIAARGERPPDTGFTREQIDILCEMAAVGEGQSAWQAARFLGALGDKRASPALARALRTARDPAAVAEIAEALAAIGDPGTAEALRLLDEGLVRDPRFKPSEGRMDPKEHALRVQSAARSLQSAPLSARTSGPASQTSAPFSIAASSIPFRYEGWPGAGRPKLSWNGTAEALPLRAAPAQRAPVKARLPLSAGDPLEFDDSVVITLKPGRVRARRDVGLEARALGEAAELPRKAYESPVALARLELREGETVELLSYREEGQCFLRSSGKTYLGSCPQNDRADFTLLEEPIVEWWLHLSIVGAAGWFSSEQQGLEFLPRW